MPSLIAQDERLGQPLFVFRVPTYKFFGPHQGVLYGRYDLLDRLRAYKARPAGDQPPDKFETGTKNHEGLAGMAAAVNYLADLGAEFEATFAKDFRAFLVAVCSSRRPWPPSAPTSGRWSGG